MIEFRIPMKTPSTTNLREHHMARAKRVKSQRGAVQRNMPKWAGGPVLAVRLTRIAPRELDSDNLQGAFKAIRDQVASGLLVDDRSPLIAWVYHQAKGEAEVVVQIWKAGDGAPPLPVGRPVERKRIPMKQPRLSGSGERLTTRRVEEMKRAPGPAYAPPEAASIHASAIRAAAESIAHAEDPRVLRAVAAAKEAEATFAPPACSPSSPCGHCMDCIGTLP